MSKHYTVISPAHKDGMPEWRIIDDQGNIVAVAYAEDIAIKIAAAPDLLEACKGTLETLSEWGELRNSDDTEAEGPEWEHVEALRAAIAKAEPKP